MLKTESLSYTDQQTTFVGYLAYDDAHSGKKPVVMVCPDWSGQNNFARQKAERLATLGYIGFAIDMYGEGKTGQTKEEKSALIQPLMQNRNLLQQRVLAAFNFAKTIAQADASRIASIGFCFGGLCALDLARSGTDVKAVVSFHGLLNAPEGIVQQPITAHVLALHGYDDPMVSHEQLIHFADEMTRAKAPWQCDIYGHTLHAFTNPEANDPGFGTVYHPVADSRAWDAMVRFFAEVL